MRSDATARRRGIALLACLVVLRAATVSPAEGAAWTVSQGEVRVVCPLTVGGSFEARTPALAGTLGVTTSHPAVFGGDLTVDLRTLDTGIDLRSDHLREEYLEVAKSPGFDKAVLSDIHLGDVDADTFQGRTSFTGTLLLHGAKKSITGQAEVRREGASAIRIEASFPITLADHGIPKPQYLGVGVKSQVQVRVSFVATPAATTSAGGSR